MNANVVLLHPFVNILPDVDEFFLADTEVGITNTVNALCYKIKKYAEKYKDQIAPEDFKGWALELFAEYLIKTNEADNRIGIYDYKPVSATDEDDVGVDGFGLGENGLPATVQVKFRAGDYVLTANEDHLSNFLTASWIDYAVRTEDDKNMLIVTTGLKIDERTREKMLKNKVRVLNREALREMLDHRPEWWTRFYEAVKNSRVKQQAVAPTKILRTHQGEAVNAIMLDDNMTGKVILPTGTGKTLIQAEVIRRVIIRVTKYGQIPIIKINSPRILLCFQLFEEIFNHLNANGIQASYINYNSGKADDKFYATEIRKLGGIYRQIVSTTSTQEVKDAYDKAAKEKVPLIVFSTYHSAEKFSHSKVIPHLTIHDEAHNLVSREFFKAAQLPSAGNLYFTATEKVTDSDEGMGMNNTEVFDNTIYSKSPREMIDVGEMIPPRVHVVRAREGVTVDLNKLDRDYDALFRSIADAFFAHQRKIRETSFDASKLGAKVLVVCRGQQDLIQMFKTNVFEKFRQEYPDVHIFALSSDFGLYMDGEFCPSPVTHSKKFAFLKKVKEMDAHEKAIIFHVDMIGEGIDVPGITGVMPFRNCELSKFVQNIGRASRLHTEDRKKVYANELKSEDKHYWIKPYSWVIVPTFLENSEDYRGRMEAIIHELRENYGYIPRQHTVIDNVKGLADDPEIDTVNSKEKKSPHADSGLDEFVHEFEKVSVTEQIIFDDEIKKEGEKFAKELDNLLAM